LELGLIVPAVIKQNKISISYNPLLIINLLANKFALMDTMVIIVPLIYANLAIRLLIAGLVAVILVQIFVLVAWMDLN
jgi:hypothetical protein